MKVITIGRIAREAGRKVQTIRHHERIGPRRRPNRSEGHQRPYGRSDIDRRVVSDHARDLDLRVEVIRELLRMAD